MHKYNLFESHYLQNELKTLVRRGIPDQLRSRVWSALYRIKIRDLKEAKGTKYFENLCSKAAEADVSTNIALCYLSCCVQNPFRITFILY